MHRLNSPSSTTALSVLGSAFAPEPTDGGSGTLAGVPVPRSCPVRSAEGGQKESRRAAGSRARALAGVLVSTSGGDAFGGGVAAGCGRPSSPIGEDQPAPRSTGLHMSCQALQVCKTSCVAGRPARVRVQTWSSTGAALHCCVSVCGKKRSQSPQVIQNVAWR